MIPDPRAPLGSPLFSSRERFYEVNMTMNMSTNMNTNMTTQDRTMMTPTAVNGSMRAGMGSAFLLLALTAACGDAGGEDATGNDDTASGSATAGEDATLTATATAAGDSGSSVTASTAGSTAGSDAGSESDGEDSSDTGNTTAPGLPVILGSAGDFAILAKTGISSVPASSITGDIGVSPAAATFITGFSLSLDATNVFSTSPQVIGSVYASDYAPPTPANLTAAVADMELAFTAAEGRAPDATEIGAGNIGGMTLEAGVYKWGTGLLIPTDLELTGSDTDVWIFQVAGDLDLANAASVNLSGGARPENIFWQVAGLVEIGTTAHCEGVILTQTSITLGTGASINGRLLAQTAVSLDGSVVVAPAD